MAWVTEKSTQAKREVVLFLSEEALNASLKSLDFDSIIGLRSPMEILGVRVEFIATATAGTRTVTLQLLDATDDDVLWELPFAVNVTAGVTKIYQQAPGLPVATGGINTDAFPKLFIGPGRKLKVFDSAAIDAAADDMVVHVHGLVR